MCLPKEEPITKSFCKFLSSGGPTSCSENKLGVNPYCKGALTHHGGTEKQILLLGEHRDTLEPCLSCASQDQGPENSRDVFGEASPELLTCRREQSWG